MRAVCERAMLVECRSESLVAVVHVPEEPADTGVIIVVGGPQYRAGSHRHFVHLARTLASQGYAVLRFDCRGMGDSTGDPRSFEAIEDDIAGAIGALCDTVPQVRRIVLWGLCDGASAALLYCDVMADSRVGGLCLANPWVRTEAGLARTRIRHYYGQRLLQREFWRKLVTGRVAASSLSELIGSMARARQSGRRCQATTPLGFQERMARAWFRFQGPVLLLLSEKDYTAQEFAEHVSMAPAWRGALERPGLERRELTGADHTFSADFARRQAEESTLRWLRRCFPPAARTAEPALARTA